ncbi:MAG: TRAP transporter small permease [Pseudomonadales bacterium]|nr:TRAP transporter small permease [Pseudomonadales bacterium]
MLNTWLVLPGIVFLVLADILMRALFFAPIPWAHEVLGLLLICLFFIGLPATLSRNELLRVDFLAHKLGKSMEPFLRLLELILISLFAIIICWMGVSASIEMYRYQETAFSISIPYWPFAVLIVAAGIITILHAVLDLLMLFSSKTAGVSNE